ncbi:alpha/beta fold hydrolase [Aestuariibaculum sediminum]|uniref:Alpha/beta hydrolase n=1 Tax=Aestuariibaculum sediminum TaxID=2770637 RepID=A0A8J6U878_9FLAO|nr:alpha/beta hydrolase [Aestuariibaculum sediminum]MBD0831017.1 alpha/beta hydrolase [Aestuariibaculum sediminum]
MTIEYKNISIAYTDTGKGNAVVLLHGFLENKTMWEPFLPEFSKTHRIICIDLLGHGETGCLGYIHSMELMAENVLAVLNHLEINKATFIGHSMGGYVALTFAENYPDKMKGLCLMNSTAQEDSPDRKIGRDRAIEAVKQNHKTFIRIAVNNLFRPKNREIFSEKIQQVIQEALNTPLQGIIAALEGMKTRPNREHILELSGIDKLMIVSKKDPVLDYKNLINQTFNKPVKLVEFPDGHMSHIENMKEFSSTMMHFIEKL